MSVASRRFYRAFYEWTLLTSPAEVGAERTCSHGFHSTAANRKAFLRKSRRHAQREHGREVLRAPHDERQWTQHFDSPRERTAIGIPDAEEKLQFAYEAAIGRPLPKMRELQKYIERWKNAPVHQATDKPFNTLQPWEEVVRYRSEMGIMLEVPVLDQDLERLKGEYRSGLETLVLSFDSRIEVQQLSAPVKVQGLEDAKIVSVLVSGTYLAVARTFHELLAYKSDIVIQTNKTASTDPDMDSASPTKSKRQRFERDFRVSSQAETPSSHLVPRGYAVRQAEGSYLQIELCLSENDWAMFLAQNSVEGFAGKHKVSITVGEPEQRPTRALSDDTAMARSLFISGDMNAVMHSRGNIFSYMAHHERKETPTPSPSIPQELEETPAPSQDIPQTSGPFPPAPLKIRQVELPPETKYGARSLKLENLAWQPTSHDIIGLPADHFYFCRFHVVGPRSAEFNKIVNLSTLVEPDAIEHDVYAHLGPRNELIVTGKMSRIEQCQKSLQDRIDKVCNDHGLGSHELEKSASTVAEIIGKRAQDRAYEVFVHGPNAAELCRTLLQEYVDGYRRYVRTIIHVKKAKNSLTFTGTLDGTSLAQRIFRQRLDYLCKYYNYPEHEVVTARRPAHPEELQGLVEKVRGTLRTLTHPVVLVTSGRRNMSPVDVPDSNEGSDGYLQGARGATVSSFSAVTMKPQPVVSFNLKLPSRTWDAIRFTKQFIVHFLASNPRGAAIAETFTRPYERPHTGFLKLREMDVYVGEVSRGRRPGKLADRTGGGIEAAFEADLLLNKCIEVEDHVIVVGKVFGWSHLEGSENRLALSYAMRGFRGGGDKIVPDYTRVDKKESYDANRDHLPRAEVAAAGIELDPLKLGEDIDSGAIASQSRKHKQETQVDEDLAEDSVYTALATTREQVRREEAADVYEAFNSEDGEHDETPHPQPDTKDRGRSESTVTSASTPSPTPAGPNTQITRPFSTFTRRPMDILGIPLQTRRFASTFTFSDTNDLSAILDPSTAQSTVSDYLSTRDEKYKPDGKFDLYVYQSRVMHLLKNQKDITRLRELLDRGYKVLDNGKEIPLTESEISSMNEKIISLERHIDIVLAINAHRMLREMLDKARYGEIFWRQVPEFERMVEKGMKVLMDVARELRQELEEGKVSAEDFKKISVKLKGRYEGLEREILRLRSVTEEEGDEVFDDDD
ncbi:hypothetical protein CB0940_02090 [Cercospora beticola]|uniref:Flavin reductase like domain-containing protein n=2 Tax=Cercospora beticola TaxID=122368 RepID=A0A2G5I903_CERBT|nr:hypothetical protein CB0940_02090 [Cercospora beticola]PIB01336.1 hypothetical protein CB0940_02090 [Cercospora beticola]